MRFLPYLIPLIVIGAIIAIFLVPRITPKTTTPKSETETTTIPGLKTAQLKPVGNFAGSGEASRLIINGEFVHSVSATIPDPPAGKFYEGWLVKKTPKLEFFSTGKMFKEKNLWILAYSQKKDPVDFKDVVITLEEKDDKQPEVHVLEGSFE